MQLKLAAALATIEALQKQNLAEGQKHAARKVELERQALEIEARKAAELEWVSTVSRLTEELDQLRLESAHLRSLLTRAMEIIEGEFSPPSDYLGLPLPELADADLDAWEWQLRTAAALRPPHS